MTRAPLLERAGHFLDVSNPACHSDFVMVLGGDHNNRPAVAAALFNAGLTRHILVLESRASPEVKMGLFLPEDEVVRRVLHARGVPDSAILCLSSSVDSTADEAVALADFLRAHPGSIVSIVTTDCHTRRARMVFQRSNPTATLHFVAAPAARFDASNWWQSESGCHAYLTEYAKLSLYTLSSIFH